MNINQYLIQEKKRIEKILDKYLPKKEKSIILQAMRYSVFSGGKRIRPILTMSTAELLGRKREEVVLTASAIELIHTFTLIHDDLPCIDDDDYRRGKLSSHKVYGEAIAVLVGDALLNQGFMLIIKDCLLHSKNNPWIYIKVLEDLCSAIGIYGLIGGETADLLSENKKINLATLENIYYRKTAALICSSVRIGAILANANKKELFLLTNYGKKLGLAFQIMDDILEATQNKKLKKSKPNYLSFFDIGSAKSMAEDKIKQAKAFLIDFGLKAKPLYSIADYIIQRKS